MTRRANTTFHCPLGTVLEGDALPDDHEIVRKYPFFFGERSTPETATARPGERRGLKPKRSQG